jgi:benzoyl-CoA reductase/2-hydroxyglutaryl-CoA dehydratase subunit BcrC/BadD/HgdB
MGADWSELWRSLGIDLAQHAGLLAVLSDAYRDIYLAQRNRPAEMAYFDFVISEVHGQRIREIADAKQAGRPVVGSFCVYVPEELVLAAGGVHIGLCAGAEVGSAAAEQYLPAATCALIKAFMGFKLAGLCPYVQLTDLIVGETTCDGKKKAYEIFDELVGGKMLVMELPHRKSEAGRALWRGEVGRLREELESLAGPITLDGLRRATATVNARRRALRRLAAARAADPCPISGLDALLVNQVSFYDDPVRFTQSVERLCDELELRIARGEGVAPRGTPRILVSGSPMAIPNWKLHSVVERAGAVVVGEEACVGERGFRDLADESFPDLEAGLRAVADRCLAIDCACFTPNPERVEHIREMRARLRASGVIHYALQFCTPYQIEAYRVQRALSDGPFLRVESDYSSSDVGQLRTRVEAFLELATA